MRHLREFIHVHLQLYKNIIEEARADTPFRKKSDFDPAFVARMAQIIVVSAGLMESIDPIDIDSIKLMKFIISLLRG
jgi:hypothetical protein